LSSSPTVLNNTIVGNYADYGAGGIGCLDHSDPLIAGNIISANSTNERGGGINCYNSNPIISNNVISVNSASVSGGGIYCFESSPTITNNTITGNSAYVSGGGIYCELVSNPVITNTIFWADSASYSPEIDFDDSSSPYFAYCDIQGGWGGEGNIDLLPLFRDPVNGDYHLMSVVCGDSSDSPCIDAGDPTIFDSMLDCDWGLGTERSDIGAYGGVRIPTDADEEQTPEIPREFTLSQNYPNPFNAATRIEYNLPSASDVTIDIYDILGRKVEALVSENQHSGYHFIIWDASDHSSGMYFYRLQANEYVETRRMVLLK
jgi:predicted outer membrane repeat protein